MKGLKNVLLCLAVLFFLIIIAPLGINEAYNIGGYHTNWDAKDVLAFYGSLIGGSATLLAIFLTIHHEDAVRRVERCHEKAKIRLKEARSQFFNAVMVLQDTNILFFDNDVGKTIRMLQLHLTEIRRCSNIEMLLEAPEKEIMKSSILRLKEYIPEYDALIVRFLDANEQLLQQEVLLLKRRLRDALIAGAGKNSDEINQLNQEVAQIQQAMNTFNCGTVFEVQREITALRNEKYGALYDGILADIKTLEVYYDQQVEQIK